MDRPTRQGLGHRRPTRGRDGCHAPHREGTEGWPTPAIPSAAPPIRDLLTLGWQGGGPPLFTADVIAAQCRAQPSQPLCGDQVHKGAAPQPQRCGVGWPTAKASLALLSSCAVRATPGSETFPQKHQGQAARPTLPGLVQPEM